MTHARWKALPALCLLPFLSGCLLSSTRSVMKTHPPTQILNASLETLVGSVTTRYDGIQSINASVDIAASVGGGKEGKVVDYTSLSGYILLRKPNDLRVLLFVPIAHVPAINMISDGKNFTMVIPPKNRAITGTDGINGTSANPLENLRPFIFLDALMIRSTGPGDFVSVTSDDRIYQPDPTRKYVVDEPEYDLGIFKQVSGSPELKTQRVIHIGRSNLLPYQQDIYDEKGQLSTVALYDEYKRFDKTEFPSRITIRRPQDRLSLVLTITKLTVNQQLEDDQFELKIPATAQVQKLP